MISLANIYYIPLNITNTCAQTHLYAWKIQFADHMCFSNDQNVVEKLEQLLQYCSIYEIIKDHFVTRQLFQLFLPVERAKELRKCIRVVLILSELQSLVPMVEREFTAIMDK